MKFTIYFSLFLMASFVAAQAQNPRSPDDEPHIQPRKPPKDTVPQKAPSENQAPSQGDSSSQPLTGSAGPGESSSRDSMVDFNAQPRLKEPAGGDARQYPFDPHKAIKDIEVGEFYLKRKNYRAALDRFTEALNYKPNDAIATFRLAQTLEKLDLSSQAYQTYKKYLEILPEGDYAGDSKAAMLRIAPRMNATGTEPEKQVAHDLEVGETYLAQNKFEDAYSRFEEAVRLSPDNPVAFFRLAESLQGLQRLDEARLYYKKYLDMQPQGRDAGEAKRAIAQINLVLGK
jgi:tetratricopeptide (TPR) repeat protein